jgi:hypothetical protein
MEVWGLHMIHIFPMGRSCRIWPSDIFFYKVHMVSARIGPSGVRRLPLAAGINEGGPYFRYIIPPSLIKSQLLTNINKNSGRKIKFGPPPLGPLGGDFWVLSYEYYKEVS